MSDNVDNRLFSLPQELRDEIYRLAMGADTVVHVHATGYERNSLLATSKAIREEALAIFYHERKFQLHLHDYDPGAGLKLLESMKSPSLAAMGRIRRNYVFCGAPNWDNILAWFFHVYTGKIDVPMYMPQRLLDSGDENLEHLVIAGMNVTAVALRGQPWALVEQVLKP